MRGGEGRWWWGEERNKRSGEVSGGVRDERSEESVEVREGNSRVRREVEMVV